MTFDSKWSLKKGPSAAQPVTLVVEAKQSDEDGSRARFEADLSKVEAQALADALGIAALGQWS